MSDDILAINCGKPKIEPLDAFYENNNIQTGVV